jgi:glucose uptake protein GlcU
VQDRLALLLPALACPVFLVVAAITDSAVDVSVAGASVSDLSLVLAIVCGVLALREWRRARRGATG